MHMYTDPWIAANAREQRVQDGVIVMAMQQDEAQEGFEERCFRYAAQEKIQVGGAGDHLVHRRLQTHRRAQKRSLKRNNVTNLPAEENLAEDNFFGGK